MSDDPYDQGPRPAWIDKYRVSKVFVVVVLIALLSTILVINAVVAGASGWSPREGCDHTIRNGEILSEISTWTGVSVADHVAVNPSITDPNEIMAGAVMDICHPAIVSGHRPILVAPAQPELPGEILRWARAVEVSRPSWATDDMVRFLVAVSGPESMHGTSLWNRHDADHKYTGSYGVVQIRILRQPHLYPEDWFRDREWLEYSFRRQARAAWMVWEQRVERGQTPKSGWGPHTDGKMPDNCNQSSDRQSCEWYWNVADQAIAAI